MEEMEMIEETGTEEIEIGSEPTDGDEGAVEAGEQVAQIEPQTTATGRPVKGNVFARNRILERENRVILRRMEDLIERLDRQANERQEPEIPEVDFDDDPLRAIHARQQRIEESIRRDREEAQRRELEREMRTRNTVANEAILDFAERTPDYAQAIEHLAAIEMEEALEENPHLSEDEVDAMMSQKLAEQKIRWIQEGRNPGQELYRRAQRRGYQPRRAAAGGDARREVVAERKRAAAGSSISKAAGRASQGKVNAGAIARMSDAEYREWADARMKAIGKTRLSTRDIMPDKMIASR